MDSDSRVMLVRTPRYTPDSKFEMISISSTSGQRQGELGVDAPYKVRSPETNCVEPVDHQVV
jgi:hypothetical protein